MVISPSPFPVWPSLRRTFLQHGFFYYRRGAWALAYGLRGIMAKRKKEIGHILLPDYFCKEPLAILKQIPISITFYPVQKNLEPDWQAVRALCTRVSLVDALVLVHYFGFSNNIEIAKNFCDEFNIELIEDCAHVLSPYGNVGTTGTLAVFSPWKLLPLPDLGLLVAQEIFAEYIESPRLSFTLLPFTRWFLKRAAQCVLCGLGINWYRGEGPRTATSFYNISPSPTALSRRLFGRYGGIIEIAKMRRRENYQSLEEFFKQQYPELLLFGDLPEGVVPYAFPCIMRESAHKISLALRGRGIPAFPWPELPDEVKRDRIQYESANFYAERLLLLPIHQSVTTEQVEYMKKCLTAIL